MKSNKLVLGIIGVVVLVGIVVVVIVAMNQDSSTSKPDQTNTNSSNAGDAVTTNSVTISNYAFSPASITVKKGTTVTWTNEDTIKHTVTADDDSQPGPKSELFGKGKTYSYTFDTVGQFPYHCVPHPYMKGTVTVTD